MARGFRFELDRNGVRNLLKSDEMQNECEKRAQAMLNSAPGDLETQPYYGSSRNGVKVTTASAQAYYKNLKENTLEKALGAAKG